MSYCNLRLHSDDSPMQSITNKEDRKLHYYFAFIMIIITRSINISMYYDGLMVYSWQLLPIAEK